VNVVDSSGWLEYFSGTPNSDFFASAIEDVSRLIVPTISICEVFKKVLRERGEGAALDVAAHMRQGRVIPLDESLALDAAGLGLLHKLPLADSIILATTRKFNATLWTQDEDFQGIPGVKYLAKKRGK
jgi:toxin FitB